VIEIDSDKEIKIDRKTERLTERNESATAFDGWLLITKL